MLKINGSDEFNIESFAHNNNMTYKSPAFKDSAEINVEYLPDEYDEILDLKKIRVSGSLLDIVEDINCHRVDKVDLFISRLGGGEPWPFYTEEFQQLQQLDMEIDNLGDFCTGYEIGLSLQGTTGHEDVEKIMKVLDPISLQQDKLIEAKDSGYIHKFDASVKKLQVIQSSANDIVVQWKKFSKDDCIEGVFIDLEDLESGELDKQRLFFRKDEKIAKFSGLNPCSTYQITANVYLGQSDNNEVIFEGESPVTLQIKTMPDMTQPFSLNTLQADIKGKSIDLVWEKSETIKCISKADLRFSVCEKYLQRGSCFQNVTSAKVMEAADEKYFTINLKGLQPCTDYQVNLLAYS